MKQSLHPLALRTIIQLHPDLAQRVNDSLHEYQFVASHQLTANAVQRMLEVQPLVVSRVAHQTPRLSSPRYQLITGYRLFTIATVILPPPTRIAAMVIADYTVVELEELLWAGEYLQPLAQQFNTHDSARQFERMRQQLPRSLVEQFHPQIRNQRQFAMALQVNRRRLGPLPIAGQPAQNAPPTPTTPLARLLKQFRAHDAS